MALKIRGPVPRSQFKGALRLLICKMQACPHPCPRGRLCHERAWSRRSRVTRVPGLARWACNRSPRLYRVTDSNGFPLPECWDSCLPLHNPQIFTLHVSVPSRPSWFHAEYLVARVLQVRRKRSCHRAVVRVWALTPPHPVFVL